ncbi:uncharacterized protein LOC131431362 [Malaya genurostris]|uniref:uncharacterized protein LOC131431362 n=1 Tax=Malaya genurostris TaxID=325434 RepID=UPI0026F3EEAB|nr:uncharacterized protein LOC131431362 [Malaya genurostris]
MAPRRTLKSVHFTDTESFSKRIFTPDRYNVPLFLSKKLITPMEHRDPLNVLQASRRKLLLRTKSYEKLDIRKADKESNIKLETGKRPTFPLPFYRCPKSLRNCHKEWMLPPNRYRLGGNISDLAIKSTGSKGPYQCFTGERFTQVTTGSDSQPNMAKFEDCKIPAEMNKLAHPKRYFVGKIRPGDRNKQRPCSRLALSQATLCWRNPAEPGPNCYFKGIFDIAKVGCNERSKAQPKAPLPALAFIRHSYCTDRFRRPPPGRYQLSTRVPPLLPPRSIDSSPPPRLELTFNPYWNPYRQAATLRMHTVDIPVRRRRKRGRNMKVAFGSGSARFKDQEFFPIGALKSILLPKEGDGVNRPIAKTVAVGTPPKLPSKTAGVASSVAGEKTDPLADFNRTRTKLFVIPRRDQTRLISHVKTPPEREDDTKLNESFQSVTSGQDVLEPAPFDDGNSSLIESEVLVTKALSGD